MQKKSNPNNFIPVPLQSLTIQELFTFTGIDLYKLEGFIAGKFRPCPEDRERLSAISRRFYPWNDLQKSAFLQRAKWRSIKSFISFSERTDLFLSPESYSRKLDEFVDKYWDKIIVAVAKKMS